MDLNQVYTLGNYVDEELLSDHEDFLAEIDVDSESDVGLFEGSNNLAVDEEEDEQTVGLQTPPIDLLHNDDEDVRNLAPNLNDDPPVQNLNILDLNDPCSDFRADDGAEDDGTSAKEAVRDPVVGDTFPSIEEFYNFCHAYGKRVGFQTSKRNTRYAGEDVTYVTVACSKLGKFTSRAKNPSKPGNSSKTDCKARLSARLDAGSGLYLISSINLVHNHPLEPENTRFFPMYRNISAMDRRRILDNDRAGVPIAKNYNSFVYAAGGHINVPFSDKDCRNLISSVRRLEMKGGDYKTVRKYFEKMSASNSNFFHSADVDNDGRLKNVFWADGRSREAYRDFGDIVSFDTTYVSNRYSMPFAPFIGVNHHGQSILFGCALLSGEDIPTFKWLFETWLTCMGGKPPKGIITDQCRAIGGAVREVFPTITHRLCIWHILRNASKHLRKHPRWSNIANSLRIALHGTLTVLEFETEWDLMLSRYSLRENNWCCDMYTIREMWVPVYFKNDFWAGLSSTQRSEGMNNFFKGYVNCNTTLTTFVNQYASAVASRVEAEEKENFKSLNSPEQCLTTHAFEDVYQKVYTTSKFKELRNEVAELSYTIVASRNIINDGSGDKVEYVIETKKPNKRGILIRKTARVTYDKETVDVKCQCKNFEFRGILCSHILSVFHAEELTFVPDKYIFNRWRKDVPRRYVNVAFPYNVELHNKPDQIKRCDELRGLWDEVCDVAIADDSLFQAAKKAMLEIIEIGNSRAGSINGLQSQVLDNVGRIYSKRIFQPAVGVRNEEAEASVGDQNHILDPVDRRKQGRKRQYRLGYAQDKNNRKQAAKKATRTQPEPQSPSGYSSASHTWNHPHMSSQQTYLSSHQPYTHVHQRVNRPSVQNSEQADFLRELAQGQGYHHHGLRASFSYQSGFM